MAARGLIELLRLADVASRRQQAGDTQLTSRWSGVAFILNRQYYIAPLGEIAEVMPVPESTPVPRAANWLTGIANVRGRLLPLTDLAAFLGQRQPRAEATAKVLIIDQPSLFSGLIVDDVLGIQHFDPSTYKVDDVHLPTHQKVSDTMAPFVQGYFEQQEHAWHVFLPSRLVIEQRFLHAAAS